MRHPNTALLPGTLRFEFSLLVRPFRVFFDGRRLQTYASSTLLKCAMHTAEARQELLPKASSLAKLSAACGDDLVVYYTGPTMPLLPSTLWRLMLTFIIFIVPTAGMACLYLALDSEEARLALCEAGVVPALVRLHQAFAEADEGLNETLGTVFAAMLVGGKARSPTAAVGALRCGPGMAQHRMLALECLGALLAGSEAACDEAMKEGASEALLPLAGGENSGDEDAAEQACLCLVLLLTKRVGSEGGGAASGLEPAPERLAALMAAGLLPRLLAAVAVGKNAKVPAEQALDIVSLSSEENAVLVQSSRALALAMVG